MPAFVRRLGPLALAAILVIGLAPIVAATEASDTSAAAIAAAEKDVLTLTNRQRTERGLVALRWDTRMAELARERAEYMARTGRFSHTQADGTSVFDLFEDANIKWYGGGEIIAWNTASLLDYSAAFAVKGWMGSSGHKAIVLSTGYNYVGFGLAISPTTGKRYWAGVYLKGPDRTPGWARFDKVTRTRVDSKRVKVTIDWSGGDSKMQVLTSGLRYFQMQKRRDGGAWYTYDTSTTSKLTRTWSRGHVYDFRVRTRDKAGNWTSWKTITVKP